MDVGRPRTWPSSPPGKDEPDIGLTTGVDKLYVVWTSTQDGHKMHVQALADGGRRVWECPCPGGVSVAIEHVDEHELVNLCRTIGCMDMLTAFRLRLAARA